MLEEAIKELNESVKLLTKAVEESTQVGSKLKVATKRTKIASPAMAAVEEVSSPPVEPIQSKKEVVEELPVLEEEEIDLFAENKPVTEDDIRKAASRLCVLEGGQNGVKKIIASFGAKLIKDIPRDKLGDILLKLEEEIKINESKNVTK